MGIFKSLKGGLKRISQEEAQNIYGPYLLENESLHEAYVMIRDGFALTSLRLIIADRQGATGKKLRIVSIPLDAIYDVTAETAGFGIDDTELTISYITTPHLRAYNVGYGSYTFEFPKDADISALYRFFAEQARKTREKLNS